MKRDTKIVAAFLAAVCLLILSASVLCTWAISVGASPRWRLLFRVMCHGFPARSFSLFGTTMPICARCVGIYIGLFAAMAIAFLWKTGAWRIPRMAMLIAAAPLAIDGLSQATGLRESTNVLRIASGLTAAFVFGLWALSELETAVNRRESVP